MAELAKFASFLNTTLIVIFIAGLGYVIWNGYNQFSNIMPMRKKKDSDNDLETRR